MSTPSDDPRPNEPDDREKMFGAKHGVQVGGATHDAERGLLYRWLSLAFQDPARGLVNLLMDPVLQVACRSAAAALRASLGPDSGELARGEVSLESLDIEPSLDLLPTDSQVLTERYGELFGLLVSRDCPPYETEYCPQTFSVYRSHQLADIAGFYHAFGLEPSRTNPERADHIALELEFMSWLILKEEHARDSGSDDRTHAQICRDAQQRFLSDHLLWWTPAFAFAMRQKTDRISEESELSSPPESFYGATTQLLAAFMRAERLHFGIPPPQRLVAPTSGDENPESTACEGCELLAQ